MAKPIRMPAHGVSSAQAQTYGSIVADAERGPSADPARGITGFRVLVVEDDIFVGLELVETLTEMGAEATGPVQRLAQAEKAAASPLDLALLDVNLAGEYTFRLAADLRRRGVPVVFVTAHAGEDYLFPVDVAGIPRVAKPVDRLALERALATLLSH
jgi:DNA-binding response OmpR family regulator